MTTSSKRLLFVAFVCVLLMGSAAGTAAAKGKIKGKQIAANAIATKHLKAAAVTGDKLADGSVTGAKLAANTVTGTQVDEATLGRVPDAAAIAGRTVTPIAMDLPNTQPSAVVVAAGPGWTLGLDCATSKTSICSSRAAPAHW